MSDPRLPILAELEKKILWLASWTIHNANHLRDSADGMKVGGHQASSASLATIMTALYMAALRPQDRVALAEVPASFREGMKAPAPVRDGLAEGAVVLAATADPHAYPAAERVVRELPGSQRLDIQGGMVPLPDQMPAEFAQAVHQFLSGLPLSR